MAKAFLDYEFQAAGAQVAVTARALNDPAPSVASEAVEVMHGYGLDVSRHQPTRISDVDVQEADLFLLMDHELVEGARKRWPDAEAKIHRIMEYATGEPSDIGDPYLGNDALYSMAAKRLRRAATAIAKKLTTEET